MPRFLRWEAISECSDQELVKLSRHVLELKVSEIIGKSLRVAIIFTATIMKKIFECKHIEHARNSPF